MTVIGKTTLKKLIEEKNLITSYKDIDSQITANGFDFRLGALIELKKAGQLRIDKSKAIKPQFGKVWALKEFEKYVDHIEKDNIISLEEGELIELDSKTTYLAVTCEKVNTPENLNFEIEPRSSLFRYCQCGIINGFGEAGYKGRLTIMFKPFLEEAGIDIGVRFIQVSFNTMDSEENYEDQKESNYQDGKII